MKKFLLVVTCMVALGVSAPIASATQLYIPDVNTSDPYYVGRINDGIPSSEAEEMAYIKILIGLNTNQSPIQIPLGSGEVYDRLYSTVGGLLTPTPYAPTVDGPGAFHENINVTDYAYILGKYDAGNAGAYVWYVAGLGSVTLPLYATPDDRYELSHYTLFKVRQGDVPDGGFTLMLLGGALVGLGALRRKFRA